MIKCKFCLKQFIPKNGNQKIFCSEVCRKNSLKWGGKCFICKSPIHRYKAKLCRSCYCINKNQKSKNKTIKDYLQIGPNHSPSWKYGRIRELARIQHKNLKGTPCQHCSYTKHTEFAHIIAISKFPETTTIRVVNDRNNIAMLCPNCHWEYDNELLTKEDISPRLELEPGMSATLIDNDFADRAVC